MKPEDIKNSISSIKPDAYMKTRIFAGISEAAPKKRSKKKIAVAAISGILSLAVFITGLGFGFLPQIGADRGNGNAFVMSVRASDSDYVALDKDKIVVQNYEISAGYEDDGNFHVNGSSDMNFIIKGENISSVTYSCETGRFMVDDPDMQEYLLRNNQYYDIIAPYTDEYGGEYIDYSDLKKIMLDHIANGDYDEYFVNSEKKEADEYSDMIDYISLHDVKEYGMKLGFDIDESTLDEMDTVAIGIISKETLFKVIPAFNSELGEIKTYTYQNVLDKNDAIGAGINWHPDIDDLFRDCEMPFSKLPHDTITVEVTLNDGTVQTAKYDFSFNNSGKLVVKTLP